MLRHNIKYSINQQMSCQPHYPAEYCYACPVIEQRLTLETKRKREHYHNYIDCILFEQIVDTP